MPILSQIDHIVVVMLENRSLDNVLGWLYAEHGNRPTHNIPPPANGTDPTYFGLKEGGQTLPLAYAGKVKDYPIMKGTCGNGLSIPGMDPWEEYRHVSNQIFGNATKFEHPTPAPACAVSADMKGFLQDFTEAYLADPRFVDDLRDALIKKLGKVAGELLWEAIEKLPQSVKAISMQSWNTSLQITQTYTPQQLPVLNGLAKNFAVSDMWFASVPSQTNPNRAFFCCGTSLGRESNSNLNAEEHFDTDTLWNVLAEHAPEKDWGIYFQDSFPPGSETCYTDYTFPRIRKAGEFFFKVERFYQEASEGKLRSFSFLEPKWGWGVNKDFQNKDIFCQGSDYHPPTSVADGEAFVKRVYDALLNSHCWAKTLLVITFDEHGGTYDHIAPPCPAPRPDEREGKTFQFKFDRYGVRVPMVLVSPWIEGGTVFRSGSELPYDHTSLTATILKWAGIDPALHDPETNQPLLGKRVSVAPTFEEVFVRTTARDDRPEVVLPPKPTLRPITITNLTPTQIYSYLAWGPTEHKPPCDGWPRYIQTGESVTYDTKRSWAYEIFDYYVAGSYWVGNPGVIPEGLVDTLTGLNRNWRLFWEGWKLALHHQEMIVTQPAPKWRLDPPGSSGIVIRNNTPARIYAHLGWGSVKTVPVGGWPRYIEPGAEAGYDPSGDWKNHDYFVCASYWVGDSQKIPSGLVDGIFDRTWRLLWAGWKPVGHHQVLTIEQPAPEVQIVCSGD